MFYSLFGEPRDSSHTIYFFEKKRLKDWSVRRSFMRSMARPVGFEPTTY
jgi:hypothetical protein